MSERLGLSEPPGLIDRIIVIGLMAVMVGATLVFGTVELWSLVALGLLIVALLVLWGIKGVIDRRLEIVAPSTALPLLALLSLAVLQSASYSLDAEATRLAAEVILVLSIAFLISTNFLASPRVLPWLRNFLIFFGLGLAVFGLIQHFTWNGKFFWVIGLRAPPPSPFGPFVNHNHFAGFVEMLTPIPLVLILRRAVRGELAILYGFAAAMMGLAVVMSLSRGGMISLVASLMFVVAFGFRPRKTEWGMRNADRGMRNKTFNPDFDPAVERTHKSAIRNPIPLAASRAGAMVVMLFTIGAGVWWVGADPVIRRVEKGELTLDSPDNQSSGQPGKETFFQSRGRIWRDTAAMIRANWVAGVGLGAYQTAYPIYTLRDGTTVTSQSHNDYLQILADAGIFGAIIALLFIFLVARDTLRASRHRNPVMAATALGASSGLFALMVHSLFDFNLQIPSNALLFLVLTSVVSRIAAAATSKKEEEDDQEILYQSAPSLRMKAAV